jgi:hypothetical protein
MCSRHPHGVFVTSANNSVSPLVAYEKTPITWIPHHIELIPVHLIRTTHGQQTHGFFATTNESQCLSAAVAWTAITSILHHIEPIAVHVTLVTHRHALAVFITSTSNSVFPTGGKWRAANHMDSSYRTNCNTFNTWDKINKKWFNSYSFSLSSVTWFINRVFWCWIADYSTT